jgi:hypothetical protein
MLAALSNRWLWGVVLGAVATILAVTPLCTVVHDDLVASLDFRPLRAEGELEPAALVRVEPGGRVAETLCIAPAGTAASTIPLSEHYSGVNYLGRAMPPLALIGSALAGTTPAGAAEGGFSAALEDLAKRHLPDSQLNAAVGRMMDTDPACSDVVRRHLASGAFVCAVRGILLRGERREKIGLQLASLCLQPANATAIGGAPPAPLPFWPSFRRSLELIEYRRA